LDPVTLAIISTIIGGIITAVIIDVARHSPKVMTWVKLYFLGLDFLVVGHDDAGKTSFYNYLRFDQFADQYPTKDTTNISEIKPFNIDKGGDLQIPIKKAWDIPGSLNPSEQAELLVKERPKVLIIFISADYPKASQWLRSFLISLREVLFNNARVSSKLFSLTVVLNKVDKIPDKADREQLIIETRRTINEILQPLLMSNVRLIDIVECTLYSSKGGEKSANEIILSAVDAIRKKQRLVP
jgi:GTPase SAR1 family protein